MSFITGCGRVILIVLNVLILLVAIGTVAVGVMLKFFSNHLSSFFFSATSGNGNVDFNIPGDTQETEIPLATEAGLLLMVFGGILFVVAFTACCGACGKWRPLLITFIVVMIIMICAQGVVGGLFFTENSVLHEKIKSALKEKIKSEYDPNDSSIFSLSINLLHYLLQCCGISGREDFHSTPPTCCKRDIIDGSDQAKQNACYGSNAPYGDLNTQGCYDKLFNMLHDNLLYFALGLGLCMLLEVVEVVFACLIVKEVNDENRTIEPTDLNHNTNSDPVVQMKH